MTDLSPFEIVDVSDWKESATEPMGRSGKVWLIEPTEDSDGDKGERWLYKPVDWQREGGVPVFRLGSDWSERIASAVAWGLGVPAARVELASRETEPGIISRRVHPFDLVHGNELLDIPVRTSLSHSVSSSGGALYTLGAILEVLARSHVEPPPGRTDKGLDASGWFAGYLVFDALVGNTDRHAQNWGVLKSVGAPTMLAPSYDHASCLGFQSPARYHEEALHTRDRNRDIAAFARRGRSRPFDGRPVLVELAVDACRRTSTVAYWRSRLVSLTTSDLEALVGRMPPARLSQVSGRFVKELLAENLRRLVDALSDI